MKIHPRYSLIPLLLVLAIGAGCGKGDDKKKPTSQVAAKVNAEEITVHQINAVLARTPNIPPEASTRAKHEILGKLIEQQVAKQAAIKDKLDRSPAVMQAIESARNEVIARAYIEKVVAAQPKPTVDEANKYYGEHPELFSRRRIFNLEEIVIQPKEGVANELRAQVAKSSSMQDVAAWLKSQDVKFTANRGVRAAEAIPMELLAKLQELKDGEIQLIEAAGGSLNVIHVVASQAAPVDEATARPRIMQFLFNRRSGEAVAAEMKRLKDKAEITYVGEFVGGAAAAEAKAKAEAEAKAKQLAEAKAKAEAEARAKAEAKAKAEAEAQARADALSKARADAVRLEAEAKAKTAPPKPVQLPQKNIEKGVGGLK